MKLPKTVLGRLILLCVGIVTLLVLSVLITSLVIGETPHLGPPPTLDISLLPPEKRTIEVQDRARRATALTGTRPPPANTPDWSKTVSIQTIPGNLTRRTAGAGIIVESGQAPFPAMQYLFENQWYTTIGNEYVNVWAGAVGDDPMQGVVVIAYIPLPGVKMTPQPGTAYKTPTKAGSVHIVDADGMRLKLASSNGNTFFFDVASAKFVSP